MTTSTDNLTDRQLLERFALQRDEESFTHLVQRHGLMVLGVCRQILRQEQDAEDAFQATFLVLSRQAGAIRGGEALPNWLFSVATRLAKRMRAAALRRQTREVAVVDPPMSGPQPGEGLGDLGPLLYEEIARLPAKYRTPLSSVTWTVRPMKRRLSNWVVQPGPFSRAWPGPASGCGPG